MRVILGSMLTSIEEDLIMGTKSMKRSPSSPNTIPDRGLRIDSQTKQLRLEVCDTSPSSLPNLQLVGAAGPVSKAELTESFKGEDAVGDYVNALPKLEPKPLSSDQTGADHKTLSSPSFQPKRPIGSSSKQIRTKA